MTASYSKDINNLSSSKTGGDANLIDEKSVSWFESINLAKHGLMTRYPPITHEHENWLVLDISAWTSGSQN